MIHTLHSTVYKSFGYYIDCEIPLPELQQMEHTTSQVDIVIRKKDLTSLWSELSTPPKRYVVTSSLIMFEIQDLAIFAIADGKTISISPAPDADEDRIRLYLLGSCMGALLMQRKVLPLHGSAVVINNKAYAFIGESGHGKSTLASYFLQQGYQLLTDDVIAVTLDSDNTPYVTPAYPQQKLWQESLTAFGMESNQLRPVFDRETKYAVPVRSQFATEPLPLAGVFELVKTECEQTELRPIHSLERLHLLHIHTYRKMFLAESGLTQWHFQTTAQISNKIAMFQLRRPLHEFTVQQLSSMVLSAIGIHE